MSPARPRTRRGRARLGALGAGLLLAAGLAGCAVGAAEPPEAPFVERSAPSSPATEPTGPVTFDLASIDHSTWCSSVRGDCFEIALPLIIGFGGQASGTWSPQPADPDGCFRLRGGASYDLWFCPAGAVVDTRGRPSGIDDDRTDVDRLIVKFKGADGQVFVRSE